MGAAAILAVLLISLDIVAALLLIVLYYNWFLADIDVVAGHLFRLGCVLGDHRCLLLVPVVRRHILVRDNLEVGVLIIVRPLCKHGPLVLDLV